MATTNNLNPKVPKDNTRDSHGRCRLKKMLQHMNVSSSNNLYSNNLYSTPHSMRRSSHMSART